MIAGLYHLATLDSEQIKSLATSSDDQSVAVLSAMIDNGLICRNQNKRNLLPSYEAAFLLSSSRYIHDALKDALPRHRDGIMVYDNILPESTRHSVDVWTRRLSYSRVDVDTPVSQDLHWIHSLTPADLTVRAIPFLRALDDLVQSKAPTSLKVSHAYIYSGCSTDKYQKHSDSTKSKDVTAIYYPMTWQEQYG